MTTRIEIWAIFIGMLAYVAILLYLGYRFKRRMNTFFSNNHDSSVDPMIEEWRLSLNKDFPMPFFYPARTAVLFFREHRVFLVYGKIGFTGTGKSPFIAKRCLYALAGIEDSEWMRLNSVVFEEAYSGTRCCVYWVNAAKLGVI